MAVNVPNPGSYLSQIGQNFVNVRDNLQALVTANNYVAAMGGTAFLEAAPPNGLGMSPADAPAFIAALGNHATFATIYQGGQPGAALNYLANAEPFTGGQ